MVVLVLVNECGVNLYRINEYNKFSCFVVLCLVFNNSEVRVC